jgi:RNA polymerase sigma factor (sigma-70 family)
MRPRVTTRPRPATWETVPDLFPDDGELLKRIAAGEEAAFSVFYRAHLDAVIAYFRRRVPDAELAFDLAAETFAAVVMSARTYAGDGPAAAWLYGIARNKLRESLRRGRVEHDARRRLGMEPVALDDLDLERIEGRALAGAGALATELAALPEPTRRALLARVVEERGYDEIAADLDCSEQVVRQRVHRGLRRLRAGLEEAG